MDDTNTPTSGDAFCLSLELSEAITSVLREGESTRDFVDAAIRSAVEARERSLNAFNARGEAAWFEYLLTGMSTPAAEVFSKIQTRVKQRRQQLDSQEPQGSNSSI